MNIIKNKFLWYFIKYLKLIFLILLYIPFTALAFLCKNWGNLVVAMIEVIFGFITFIGIYQSFIKDTSDYVFLIIGISGCIIFYWIAIHSLVIESNLRTIIKAIKKCKYGCTIKWVTTNSIRTNNAKNTVTSPVTILESKYQQKMVDQKKHYETILQEKEQALNEIRKQNENNDLFIGVTSTELLKKRYKDLLKVYHPDNQGGNIIMTIYLKEKYEEELKKYM